MLHVEDDPNSRRLVSKLLGVAGHQVVDAAGGLQGIELARTIGPDLVLLDVNVPDLDGYEVTLRLRGIPSLQGVPIVIITAEGDRTTSLAVGADGFIEKPIDAMSFAATIERFLGGHREPGDEESDVTHRLRSQGQRTVERLEAKVRELEEANARLEDMARLRREFMQNVSHELATPMTPVVGYLKLLLAEELGPLTPLQSKCIKSIDRSTTRLRGVVDTLLDVSALESGRMHFFSREFDFAGLVREVLDKTDLPESVELRAEGLDAELPSRGDPDKIRRALTHILDNALKFTPRGGIIAVDVRTLAGDGERVPCEVRIADSGPGVPAEEQARIFEPFYQIDGSPTRRHGGVGLGLAFAQRVAAAMSGRIRVVSPPAEDVAGERLPGTMVAFCVDIRGVRPPEP